MTKTELIAEMTKQNNFIAARFAPVNGARTELVDKFDELLCHVRLLYWCFGRVVAMLPDDAETKPAVEPSVIVKPGS